MVSSEDRQHLKKGNQRGSLRRGGQGKGKHQGTVRDPGTIKRGSNYRPQRGEHLLGTSERRRVGTQVMALKWRSSNDQTMKKGVNKHVHHFHMPQTLRGDYSPFARPVPTGGQSPKQVSLPGKAEEGRERIWRGKWRLIGLDQTNYHSVGGCLVFVLLALTRAPPQDSAW